MPERTKIKIEKLVKKTLFKIEKYFSKISNDTEKEEALDIFWKAYHSFYSRLSKGA